MERVGFILKVRADKLPEYREAHKEVWPEMLQALRETGWHNYSLFLRPDGLLFGYAETPSWEKALSGMAGLEVNKRWQKAMSHFFEPMQGRADENMMRLEEVFHLD